MVIRLAYIFNSVFINFATLVLLVCPSTFVFAEEKDNMWSGTITIERTERYDCEIEPTEELGWRSLNKHDLLSSKAVIDIQAADIPYGSHMEASGTVQCLINNKYRFGVEPESTYCLSTKRDVSPGNWVINKSTFMGHATCPITNDGVNVGFSEDLKAAPEDMEKLTKELQGCGTDITCIERVQKKMESLMKADDYETHKITIHVQVLNIPHGTATVTDFRETYDACSGKKTIERDDTNTVEMDFPTGLFFGFSGTYAKGKDRKDQITGSYSKTWAEPHGKEFDGKEYLLHVTEHCTVNLIRHPVKPPTVHVQEVYFNYEEDKEEEGQEKDKVITLKRHEDNSKITPPEWTRDGKREPAAFVRGYQFKVKVGFGADKNVEWAEVSAEEVTKEGGGFGGIGQETVEFEDGKGEEEFVVTNAQQVVGVNKVSWKWKAKVKYRGEDKPKDMELGSTEHTIYIVGGEPVKDADSYVYVVKKGCEWAEGTQGGDETFNKIWEKFWQIPCPAESPCPNNPLPGVLAYVHGENIALTTGRLLREGKGRCGAWQDLFDDMVDCQGIKIEMVDIEPAMGFDCFMVKRISPQGVSVPQQRVFYEHAIIEYNGHYYDPSYHFSTSNNLPVYENQTFVGYCIEDEVKRSEKVKSACGHLFAKELNWKFVECILRLEGDKIGCVKNDPKKCEVRIRP
jgi:hypothetical protein